MNKPKGLGLFSKLSRRSLNDLTEWNKYDGRLMRLIEEGDLKDIASYLKKKKTISTKLDPQGHSALHVASMRNKYDVVQLLIAYGANITTVDFQGRTALHCAARHGACEVLKVLCHCKEDDWPRDDNSMTALHHSCIGGNLDCVLNLIRNYPKEMHSKDEDGRTPLFYAAQIGHIAVCKELMDRGTDVNTQDKYGRTPLMCAAENGNREICELLVKKGANTDISDNLGHTAAWLAIDAGHTAVKHAIEGNEESLEPKLAATLEYSYKERDHSTIPEESESVFGDENVLVNSPREVIATLDDIIAEGHRSGSESDLSIGSEDNTDAEEIKLSIPSSSEEDDDDDGCMTPRLSQLSYTMSEKKSNPGSPAHSNVNNINEEKLPLLTEMDLNVEVIEDTITTDQITNSTNRVEARQTNLPSPQQTASSIRTIVLEDSLPAERTERKLPEIPTSDSSAVPPPKPARNDIPVTPTEKPDGGDVLLLVEGISLSSGSSSDVTLSSDTESESDDSESADDGDVTQTNGDVTRRLLPVIQKTNATSETDSSAKQEDSTAELKSGAGNEVADLRKLLEEQLAKNATLEKKLITLQGTRNDPSRMPVEEAYHSWSDSDLEEEELSPADIDNRRMDEPRPVAKVSGQPRQISLRDENREIAKLRLEIQSLEHEKTTLHEQIQSLTDKNEESERGRRKLYSELDIVKTSLGVKNLENSKLSAEANELKLSAFKYRERSIATLEQNRTYKKDLDKMSKKLELYDKEYRKVKDRLKRKDANEKKMLKDRHVMMRKLDDALKHVKEAEAVVKQKNSLEAEENEQLLTKCEELEQEVAYLSDQLQDQGYELDRLSEMASCNEEILELKQLEVQSLEKQITLLRDVNSTAPQRRDSFSNTQKTIKSLQEQVNKLQKQLAETAISYQETIEIYRNHLLLASHTGLDQELVEALQHITELRISES